MPDPTYKLYLKDRSFLFSAASSILFLCASVVVNFYAGTYATENASNSVTDIILSNTRTFDVDGLFIYGTIFFLVFLCLISLSCLPCIPFAAKSFALFVLIRSLFISLTHIGPFPSQIPITSSIISRFSFGGDLFFSGHVGIPFLMALVFWKNASLRVFFIASSVVAGAIVLLGHLHYSIDVLSAFFITYTIYRMARVFFKKDLALFQKGM